MADYIREPERKIPIRGRFDVLVVGGGPAGIGSAVSAARNGAKTLLLERYGFLGGMFTAGLVIGLHTDKLYPLKKFGEKKPLIGGIAQEVLQRLIEMGGAVEPSVWLAQTRMRSNYIPSDPELLKITSQEIVLGSRVQLLLHCLGVQAIVEKETVLGVFIESKSGREAFLANVVIDCTGDGDIAASAGAEYENAGTKNLPMTLMAMLGNVDLDRAKKYTPRSEPWQKIMDKARKEGFQRESVLPERPVAPTFPMRFVLLPEEEREKYWQRHGETHGWSANYRGDCTRVEELTKGEIKTRGELLPMMQFLRKNVEGYEKSYLLAAGPQIGTRESRRILGEYILTLKDDIDRAVKHPDNICRGRRNRGDSIEEADPAFDIPYRCLVPKRINGILIAGRCISIDHAAGLSISIRDGVQSIGLGQAAGTAAALASNRKVQPRELEVGQLQKTLVAQGMNLEG